MSGVITDTVQETTRGAALERPFSLRGLAQRLGFSGAARSVETGAPAKPRARLDLVDGAMEDLREGRVTPTDRALRVIAASMSSPLGAHMFSEAERLAEKGVRLAFALRVGPTSEAEAELLARVKLALGDPPLERFLRIASFPGAGDFTEQAMIGDRAHWAGRPIGAPAPSALEDGLVTDLRRIPDAPDAARLGFAAAWRLSQAPSVRVIEMVFAARRAL